MEKICIVSRDRRFAYAKDFFIKKGYDCEICDVLSAKNGDVILLSPKSELSDTELYTLFSDFNKNATVFTGNGKRVEKFYGGRVLDYSESESFLLDNAYVTAQCAIKLTFENTDFSLNGKQALVLGYGRIGKYLSSMLKSLGTDVFIYARREETRIDLRLSGYKTCALSDIDKISPDLVYNTVPYKIVEKSVSDSFPKDAIVMELASSPGGFYDEYVAINGAGLPGRLMPRSAGKAIYDYVSSTLSRLREENSI